MELRFFLFALAAAAQNLICASSSINSSATATQGAGNFGNECTIQSVLYPDEFLSMKSGWWHKFAVLAEGNPRQSKRGDWNWRGIWSITQAAVDGEKVAMLQDQKSHKYLNFNRDMYPYLRGESNKRLKDNLWIIAQVGAGQEVTLQRFMSPKEFLQVKLEKKKNERELGMGSEAAQFIIEC